jgi:ferredoxin
MRKDGATAQAYLTFGYLERFGDLVLDYHTTYVAPKRLFLPDNEVLFGFRKTDEGLSVEDSRERWAEPRVLFGIHPCDIAALARLDKVFDELFRDPYYEERRANTIIVGMTCGDPADTCFCHVTRTGPDADEGYDLLLTDLGDRYFVRVGSKAGEQLVRRPYFQDAAPADGQLRQEAIARAIAAFREAPDTAGLTALMAEKYDDPLWDEFSDRCVTCGTCNMVCPTCHCFVLLDKTNVDQTEGKRVRLWDSCHFERFGRMAGGVDVRATKSSRFKHRLYDKFYYCTTRYGVDFCVGCGRCVAFCQCDIDLRDALRKLQEQ